jgi:O-Antigen ligase
MPDSTSFRISIEPWPHGWRNVVSLETIAALAVLGVALYLVATEPLGWVVFLAAGILVSFALVIRWPYGAILTLMSAAAMPRWSMSIFSLHAKPEHLTALACGVLLLIRTAIGKNRWKLLERVDWLLVGFLAMNVFSSFVASPQPGATLRWSMLLLLATLPFFLVRQLVTTEEQLDRAMVLWLWVGALEALFGILCFLFYLAFGTTSGLTFFFYLDFIPGVHGSQWEPNIFGSYCACFAVMFLFYFLASGRKNGGYLMGLIITSLGVLLSLARQGWVCLIVVGTAVMLYNFRRGKIQWKRLLPLTVGLIAALIVATSLMKDLPERLATLAIDRATEDPTIANRMAKMVLALADIKEHPVIGLGSSSYQLLYVAEDDKGITAAWLDNLFLKIMHDTGIVGMILFICFAVELGRKAWRVLASPIRGRSSTALGALCAGALVLLIAYQLTDASTLAFTWIDLGLMAAALHLTNTAPAPSSLA